MWLFILLYGISCFHTAIRADDLSAADAAAIEKKILDAHNKYREMHSAPPLELDAALTAKAVTCAGTHAEKDQEQVLCAEQSETIGKNIWSTPAGKMTDIMNGHPDEDPVRHWYDEVRVYPGIYRPNIEIETGAFTQVIWKSTKKLGCGFKASATNKIFVVCLYEPKGNKREKDSEVDTMVSYQHNVQPPKGETWEEESDNSLSWWFVILIFVCVGSVGGWRIYRRQFRRRRRRSSVKPGTGVRRVSGAKAGPGFKPVAGAKPMAKAATPPKTAKPAATKKPAVTQPAATKKPSATQPAATKKPSATQPASKKPSATQPAATAKPAAAAKPAAGAAAK